ncbi:hypothetical protein G7B40_036380 [Aetokthonos hydrillicola Thurmond2011]|jgi:hypothetical protein|uniref:Uncharacterized protein n=1 Tax=Aetokthonos hydrillicola Thurmond2011 TaxID=2712845 RepID=A0AAP5IFY7_9CYAN|nr:hypothetical protein [Aetokthonos hydrillicola]MBO3457934.1 hypothetical protein [Aetokthonos hydrillicola CCALA 1050]MBW4587424.1 hypothetical protein [Aetokthonos hydrillicola CCALA 1050]MDR9899992.1 hypothetical protein [Aetokthonos hydrillicola Thurmond2011]
MKKVCAIDMVQLTSPVMKPNLLRFLTVCLLTLVVLSPALGVISLVWMHHLDFIATQHLLYAVKDAQQLSTNRENTTIYVLVCLMFFAPISLCSGIALHNRYVLYRAAVLRRQVEILEKLWQRNTYPEEIYL